MMTHLNIVHVRQTHVLALTFVTEQTSPVLLAGAMPGLVAGPVDAARVRQALVAERALPAVVTPAAHSGTGG